MRLQAPDPNIRALSPNNPPRKPVIDLRYRIFTGTNLHKPENLCYLVAMKLETIENRPSYSKPVPAFSFLFANAAPQTPRAKREWLKRPALRAKRV